MKEQAKLPVMILVGVAAVALLVFFGSKAMSVGDLDQGQAKYTPGVPPWKDPLKQGAAGTPSKEGMSGPAIGNRG